MQVHTHRNVPRPPESNAPAGDQCNGRVDQPQTKAHSKKPREAHQEGENLEYVHGWKINTKLVLSKSKKPNQQLTGLSIKATGEQPSETKTPRFLVWAWFRRIMRIYT